MAVKQKNIKSNQVLEGLVETARENGYCVIFNGTEDNKLQLVAFPYKDTLCSQEDLARKLSDVLDRNHVTDSAERFDRFKEEVEPDDLDGFSFSYAINREVCINVFHNQNILLKQINLKI